MRTVLAAAAVILLGAGAVSAQQRQTILFVGNSFTFGSGSAARYWRANTLTDVNNEGIGGVPALFKSFTQQAGLDYEVALETRGGVGLDFHLENKLGVIGKRGWDTVVAHGYSTLDREKPRDPAKLMRPREIIRIRNRCKLCGKPRAVYRKFGICRICFRGMASDGLVPGVTKASW